MKAIRILTYIGVSFIYYSCSNYESRMIDGGNAIVERIESYIDSVGTTPESLSDILLRADRFCQLYIIFRNCAWRIKNILLRFKEVGRFH